MSDEAVFTGTYSDFKVIKTRKVAQVVVEIPIERSETFVSKFGLPQPHEEKWVAIAWLKSEKVQQNGVATKAIQQAGILCKDEFFGHWLSKKMNAPINPKDEMQVQELLRGVLGVQSRSELRDNEQALTAWHRLYKEWMDA